MAAYVITYHTLDNSAEREHEFHADSDDQAISYACNYLCGNEGILDCMDLVDAKGNTLLDAYPF